jgi:hypothetical protein
MICKRCGAFLSQASGSFKLGKELLCRANSSGVRIFQTLPNAFFGIGLRRNVEQPLVGFGILHYCGGLAVHGKHHGPLALLQVLEKVG